MNHKKSTEEALNRYFTKQAKATRPKRANGKPEKLVEKECVVLMNALGWDVGIYEAKSVYNPHAGQYISQRMKAGTVDCQGVMPDGTFVAIEFKALGRRPSFNSTRNYRQKEYLISKINHNAFGAVVDSANLLKQLYESWKNIEDKDLRRQFLLDQLP